MTMTMKFEIKKAVKETLTPSEAMKRQDFFQSWVDAACTKAEESTPPVQLDRRTALECLTSVFAISRSRQATDLQTMMPQEIIDNKDRVLKSLDNVDAAKLSINDPAIWLLDTYPTAMPK